MTPKMISAKLIKSLEQEGFSLEFPGYASNEIRIIEIIKSNNERLLLALPLLLQHKFDYAKIIKHLNGKNKNIFNRLIFITREIFKREKIKSPYLAAIIKKQRIHQKIPAEELEYYSTSFKSSQKQKEIKTKDDLTKLIDMRGTLNLNQALALIYSPGKRRIMDKIFNHEILTNTELKYYYRSIRPLSLAILNENMPKYLRIIESTKKYTS